MEDALDRSEVLGRRFRHCAGRSLMILRNYLGRSKSVGRQARSSRLLIAAVRRISEDFPILKETKREILEDLMDIEHAEEVIQQIEDKKIEIEEITTEIPTPFAFNLIAQGYSDIIKMSDRQEFLKKMHEMILLKLSLQEKRKSTS